MRRIIGYLNPYWGAMLVGFAIKFTGTIMDLALPWILAYMIDDVAPTGSRPAIFAWGAAMVVCSIVALLGNVIANRRASAVARDATRAIRHDLFAKIERLSSKQMDELTVPSLISRLTTDTYNVNQTSSACMQRHGYPRADSADRRHRALRMIRWSRWLSFGDDVRCCRCIALVGVAVVSRQGHPDVRPIVQKRRRRAWCAPCARTSPASASSSALSKIEQEKEHGLPRSTARWSAATPGPR